MFGNTNRISVFFEIGSNSQLWWFCVLVCWAVHLNNSKFYMFCEKFAVVSCFDLFGLQVSTKIHRVSVVWSVGLSSCAARRNRPSKIAVVSCLTCWSTHSMATLLPGANSGGWEQHIDMIRTDKTLNGNSIACCKICGTGAAHGHEERVMASKTS